MRARVTVVVVVAILVAIAVVQLVRPIPAVQVQQNLRVSQQVPGRPMQIDWPTEGEAALAVTGVGLMGSYGPQKPVPIASVTKIMTAYLVLKQHPLPTGQEGPTLTITEADVKQYLHDVATGQSLVKVQAGEKLTERQLLEALLLPSANNAADILANWAAGSKQAFVAKMNATAAKLGMKNTHYVDVSGVNPGTVSTAVDQLKIAEQAMAIPAFRHTVAMPQVTLPVAGLQFNVDYALGKSGIIGVKTGSTDQAGGCFVFATKHTVAGRNVLLIGAVVGQQGNTANNSELMKALHEGETLSAQAGKYLRPVPVVTAGATVGQVSAPGTSSVAAVVPTSQTVIGWPGLTIRSVLTPAKVQGAVAANAQVGTLAIEALQQNIRIPVLASAAVSKPSLLWRLKRIPFVQ